MAMNRIQFQAGLSLPSFLEQYRTEAQCEAALELARWHQGFRCPACGEVGHYVLKDNLIRKIHQYNSEGAYC
jgi:predicted RNA-binding Zn-ribbon protein involved in translation (DUF1610 family)